MLKRRKMDTCGKVIKSYTVTRFEYDCQIPGDQNKKESWLIASFHIWRKHASSLREFIYVNIYMWNNGRCKG